MTLRMNQFLQHKGYARTFRDGKLTLGLGMPIESYEGHFPKMDLEEQVRLAKKAEADGFAALFVRDAPLYDPNFGDVGFLYDPFMYLTYIAAQTEKIALGTASIVTTLRHPLHVAKSAATLDHLSKGRFLFGAATGDRPIEFPTFKVNPDERVALFQESVEVIRQVWREELSKIETSRVSLTEGDVVPKPLIGDIPLFGTGYSGQTLEWLAKHTDGWFFYAQGVNEQRELVKKWREATTGFKPFTQTISIDLSDNPREAPKPIQGGFRAGHLFLRDYLRAYEDIGVNHVVLGLKAGKRPAEEVIQELGEYVVPHFSAHTTS